MRRVAPLLTLLSLVACAPGDRDVRVVIELGGRGDDVRAFELRVDDGACALDPEELARGTLGPARIAQSWRRDDAAPTLGRLARGELSLSVLARGEDCAPLLFGCAVIPIDGGVARVALEPLDASTVRCGTRACDRGICEGEALDAGADAALDAGADAALDAALDGGTDASLDATPDAPDAGPECASDGDCVFGTCDDGTCDDVVGLALGKRVTCLLRESGRVACAGRSAGVLGEDPPTMMPRPRFADVPGLSSVRSMVARDGDACAVYGDGSLACWGAGAFGGSLTPTRVAGLSSIEQVAMGTGSTCARSATSIDCWGFDQHGELADLEEHPATCGVPCVRVPVDADRLEPLRVRSIALGASHGCALLDDDTVSCWGRNDYGQLGHAPGTDGDTTCMGYFGEGPTPCALAPTPVAGLDEVESIAAGALHTCAIQRSGALYCWGSNTQGQLGVPGAPDAAPDRQATPQRVRELLVRRVGAGGFHTCALSTLDEVLCWGIGAHGNLARGDDTAASSTPARIALELPAVELGVGTDHACVRLADRSVWCWGRDDDGEQGDGAASEDDTRIPTRVLGR